MEPRIRGKRNSNFFLYWEKINRTSNYIHGVDSITPGTLVWLWCRVSTKAQFTKGNHLSQEAAMRAAVAERHGEVVGVTHCNQSCNEFDGDSYAKVEGRLNQAAREAERAGAVLMAVVTSRFARHPEFKSRDKDDFYEGRKASALKAGHEELSGLSWVCGEMRLVTLLDPDATNKEEVQFLSKLGKEAKGKKGGRPKNTKPEPGYKKRRWEELQPEVLRLHGEGLAQRAIARTLSIPESTVRSWVRSFSADGPAR